MAIIEFIGAILLILFMLLIGVIMVVAIIAFCLWGVTMAKELMEELHNGN